MAKINILYINNNENERERIVLISDKQTVKSLALFSVCESEKERKAEKLGQQ